MGTIQCTIKYQLGLGLAQLQWLLLSFVNVSSHSLRWQFKFSKDTEPPPDLVQEANTRKLFIAYFISLQTTLTPALKILHCALL
jgi:hypothetical protein